MRLIDFIMESQFLIERDVMNASEIKKWAIEQAARIPNAVGKSWYQSQLFNYLINQTEDPQMVQQVTQPTAQSPEWLVQKLQSGSPVYQVTTSPEFIQQASEVRDWINNWADENPGSRINFTWEQAVKASDQWHRDLSRGADHGEETFDDPGIAIFHEASDGYRWVDVQSTVCLKREGGRMGHCVGSYGGAVERGETKVLSLRSPQNKPHITIDVSDPVMAHWDYHASRSSNTDQGMMYFMEPKVGATYGKITQIKGKQNAPPVPKYIPYVKDLLETYTFTMGYGGHSDLESIGYYYKDGKVLGLKDIAKVILKMPDKTKWVLVVTEGTDESSGSSTIKLVDANWTPLISGVVDDQEGTEGWTVNNLGVPKNAPAYKEHVLALLDKFHSNIIAVTLYKFGLYDGDGGIGELDVASGGQFTTLDNGWRVYKLKDHTSHYNRDLTALYLFDGENHIANIKLLNQGAPKDTVKITDIEFINDMPDYETYVNMIKEISEKLSMPIYNPNRLGIDKDGSQIDFMSRSKVLGSSGNKDFEYYLSNDGDDIYMFDRNELNYPLAIITIDEEGDYSKIYPGVISEAQNDGLFGYAIVDLVESNYMSIHDSKYNNTISTVLAEHGWGASYNNNYWYVGGLYHVDHHTLMYTVNDDGSKEVTFEGVQHFLNIDEEIWGSEDSEHSLSEKANYLHNGSYNHEAEREVEDEDEEYVIQTEHIDVTIDDPRSTKPLNYYDYDHEAVRRLRLEYKD